MTGTPEFSRRIDLRAITTRPVRIEANADERAALARRFGIIAIGRLEAEVALEANGDEVQAKGALTADIVQACAISGDDLPARIRETIDLRFVPAERLEAIEPATEVELEAEDLDQIFYTGTSFDLGEAVAQSLALAIDPYATGPDADAVRREQGLLQAGAAGPLADALKALRKR
jgi:uncharacterized metal-binding protein YceD (DUF177 family)